jgi:hypothetical protein
MNAFKKSPQESDLNNEFLKFFDLTTQELYQNLPTMIHTQETYKKNTLEETPSSRVEDSCTAGPPSPWLSGNRN